MFWGEFLKVEVSKVRSIGSKPILGDYKEQSGCTRSFILKGI